MNVGDQNGKRYSIYLENKRIAYEFLNNGNITVIKLIVNLIMCGFSGKRFNAAFITFYYSTFY